MLDRILFFWCDLGFSIFERGCQANHGGSHIPAPRTSSRSLRHILPDREKINRYIGAGQDGKAAKVQLQSLLILEVLAIYLQKALAVFPGGVDR